MAALWEVFRVSEVGIIGVLQNKNPVIILIRKVFKSGTDVGGCGSRGPNKIGEILLSGLRRADVDPEHTRKPALD